MTDHEKSLAWLSNWTEKQKVDWFAENVMGWHYDKTVSDDGEEYEHWSDEAFSIRVGMHWNPLRNYADTHDLIAEWSEKEPEIHMRLWGEWMVWTEGHKVCVEQPDFREAVCRACFISLA